MQVNKSWASHVEILFIFFLISFLFQKNLYGENTMQPLYNLNRALMPRLEPKIYSTKNIEIEGIFEVPVDNAIATNKIGNAITLLHFNGKKIKYKTVKKDLSDLKLQLGTTGAYQKTAKFLSTYLNNI